MKRGDERPTFIKQLQREREKKNLSPLQRSGETNRDRFAAATFALDQQIHFPNTEGKTTTKREKQRGLKSFSSLFYNPVV